ncbi:hypothetical protein GCM10023258_13250 [Terrabacter aeriphilus]|uniref:Transcriptional regulator, AbiEi antitoxin, Type IV TA system n=1 Tax=Terrabacter aeriphilus TaxID=515662 RepID=A0ABP9J8D0_9MICO
MHPLLRARAAGQAGLLTRAQALDGGLTRKAVQWRLASGRWLLVHPGVYQTLPGRDDWEAAAVAALLHAGAGSALHGTSAAHLWGLVRAAPTPITVVIPATRRVRPVAGVVVLRSRQADGRVDPFAWPHRTTVEHTVMDLCDHQGADRVVAVTAKALGLGLTTPALLREALASRPRQSGRRFLLELLTEVADGFESPAERRYVRDAERAHGLPRGRSQSPFGRSGRRDREYEQGVVVEVDGRLGHAGWLEVQRDGRRDRAATVAGRTTLRCFWSDLVPSACVLAGEVALVLRAKGWQGAACRCGSTCALGATPPPWSIGPP